MLTCCRMPILVLVSVIAALAVLPGCSGHGLVSATREAPVVTGFNLAPPSQLARQVSASNSPRFRRGQEHIPDMLKNAAPGVGDELVFSPAWDPANPDPAGMAYAIYEFDLAGYTGPTEVMSYWDLEPIAQTSWIGLSNFDTDSWDWYEFPSAGLLPYDPAIHTGGSGTLFVAYVILDDTDRTLNFTRIGPDLPPDASIVADVQSGLAPLAVNFTAEFSEDFEGEIIKYEFDLEGDGTWIDNGTTATYSHSYTAAGGRLAAVRVTDTALNTSTATVRIGAGWQHSWGGVDYEQGHSVVVDGDGNAYLLGLTTTFGQGSNELLIMKYDPAGNIIWQKTFGNASGDDPTGIILGTDGNLYIAGSDMDAGDFSYTPFVLSLNLDGTIRWQTAWVHTGSTEAMGIAWGADGSVLVACTYSPPFPSESDVLFLKYNAVDGTQLWAKTWGGSQSERVVGLDTDPLGNAYVLCRTSSFSVLNALDNCTIVKFNSSGDLQMETVYGIDVETEPHSISCKDGFIYLSTMLYVAQLTADGVLNWQAGLTSADTLGIYNVHAVPGRGCFLTYAIGPGFLNGGLIGIDLAGNQFYCKAFTMTGVHQDLGGMQSMPDLGMMLTGRTADNTGVWEDYSVTLTDPALEMTPVTGAEADIVVLSVACGLTLADVPPGTATIDTGGGGADLTIQRFFPLEPSNW